VQQPQCPPTFLAKSLYLSRILTSIGGLRHVVPGQLRPWVRQESLLLCVGPEEMADSDEIGSAQGLVGYGIDRDMPNIRSNNGCGWGLGGFAGWRGRND
jgi:hypothetical protein